MNDHELLAAIRAAGEVPPPPDRDAAFERAMRQVRLPGRSVRRTITTLVAAALLVVPAGVFQTVGGLVDDPATTPDVVRPFSLPPTSSANTNPPGTQPGSTKTHAVPSDRDDVLSDPQPTRGTDDQGHRGKGEPCGPSADKGGPNVDKRRGPCADDD